MPYTLAHPGFSFLVRKYIPGISAAGVIFGSIAPDLDLIFSLHNSRFHVFDYSLLNIVTVILPITLALLLYYRLFAESIYRKLIGGNNKHFKLSGLQGLMVSIPLEVFSILIGISVHLCIDFVTHWNAGLITWTIYYLLGTGNIISYSIYYITWYLPQVLFTLLGFYLIYKYYGNAISLSGMWLTYK